MFRLKSSFKNVITKLLILIWSQCGNKRVILQGKSRKFTVIKFYSMFKTWTSIRNKNNKYTEFYTIITNINKYIHSSNHSSLIAQFPSFSLLELFPLTTSLFVTSSRLVLNPLSSFEGSVQSMTSRIPSF